MGGHIGTGQSQFLTLVINQGHGGTNILACRGTFTGIHDRNTAQPGELIGLALDGHALFHATELNRTGHFGDDGVGVGIPTGNDLSSADGCLVLHLDRRTVGHFVALALSSHGVEDGQFPGAGNRHQRTIGPVDHFDVVQLDGAV